MKQPKKIQYHSDLLIKRSEYVRLVKASSRYLATYPILTSSVKH